MVSSEEHDETSARTARCITAEITIRDLTNVEQVCQSLHYEVHLSPVLLAPYTHRAETLEI
jgi:hypothetical protein